MSSLKQLIVAALIKVATPVEGEEQVDYASPELARDAFVAKVVAELFPESAEVPAKPKAAPKKAAKAESPKKGKAEAKTESPKKGKASPKKTKAEAKPEEAKTEVVVPVVEAKPEAKPEESPKKGKRGPMSEEAKAAMAAKRAATMAAKKAGSVEAVTEQLAQMTLEPAPAAAGGGSPKKPKAAPKKAKEEVNLAKIDPTWRKTLKEADKANAKEHEPALLAYLNAMPKEAFHAKGAKEHVADFLASRGGAAPAPAPAPAPVASVEADLEVVEFQGKDYYVNPETKRVYEGVMGEDGTLTVTRPVGYVGMADFKEMSLE